MLEELLEASARGVTVIEEDIGAVSSILARQIGTHAVSIGKKVCYLSLVERAEPLPREEILGLLAGPNSEQVSEDFLEGSNPVMIKIEPGLLSLQDLKFDVVIFEGFSAYLFDKTEREIVDLISVMRKLVSMGRSFVLIAEGSMLSDKIKGYVRSLSDNVIIVRTEIIGDKINRLLYIPKMKGQHPEDRLTKFTIETEGIEVDTREFVG